VPTVRKLTTEEVQTIENKGKGQRKLTEEEYDRYLAEYGVGDYGEAVLDPNENRLTVRNRFKAAAGRRGVGLEFRRTTGDMIRFKVVSRDGMQGQAQLEDGTAAARAPETNTRATKAETPAPEAAPKKRGGRPRKAASA